MSFDSKSLLAKLMATEDLTVEQRKVQTASFDVRNRILTIPVLDNKISGELYDLFMGHEVGHALYTPLEGMIAAKKEKVNMSVLNVVEDSRIERKIKYKYPGLRNSFITAYGELMERDFFLVKDKDLNKMNLIDRINIYCKVGAGLAISFNEEERELLDAVESTETYDDAVEVTKRLVEYMKEHYEEMEIQTIEVQVSGVGDGENGEEEGESAESDVEQEGEPQGNGQGEEKEGDNESKIVAGESGGSESQEKPEENEQTKKNKASNGSGAADETQPEIEIRSHTDDAYKQNEHLLFSTDKTSYAYVDIPKFDTKKIYDYKQLYKDYKEEGFPVDTKEFLKYRREANKVVSYLVKEFELRKNADQMKKASTSKTGDLNMSKIYSYKFNDDIFKRMTVVPNGKSHGLVMYIDWSGSMVNHLGSTVKQLLNLALFCQKVNIPFEVYSFIEETKDEYMHRPIPVKGTFRMTSFGLLNILSSRMSSVEFTTAAGALMHISGIGTLTRVGHAPYWFRMGGTPLNEAVITAFSIVPEFQKRNRLQVVNTVFLTDGEGHSWDNVFIDNDRGNAESPRYNGATHIVARDKITRNQETYPASFWGNERMAQTNALIKLLKKRTNAHVIGFFVASGNEFGSRMAEFFPEVVGRYELREKKKLEFRETKYVVATQTGFDDYYVLRSNGLDTDDESELVLKENMTTRGMVSAFSKYAGNRVNNRVILNRFIGLIS
jgi:hypothetical protein